MKTVKLYGELKAKFGGEFHFEVATAAEAVRALCATVNGFGQYFYDNLEAPFQVLVGDIAQDEEGLHAPVGQADVIHIVPMIAGAKDSWGQILTGVALIAAVYFTGGAGATFLQAAAGNWLSAATINFGMAMVIGGVSQMLAGVPKDNLNVTGNGNNDVQTWTFGSPTLTTGQGGCVPLGWGEMMIGGVVISAGVSAETWQDKGFGGAAPDNAGTRGGDGSASPWVWCIAP